MQIEGINQLQTTVQPPAPADENRRALADACRQFESIFIEMLLERMRATIPESGLVEKRFDSKVYESMFDEQLARVMAGSGGLGLARQLYEQLSKSL